MLLVALLFPLGVWPALLFSPPSLVAFSATGSSTLSPSVPDKYFALSSSSGQQSLLFGVQDTATLTASSDGGATWVPQATPHDLTSQGNPLVPVYSSAGSAGPPTAYHDIGATARITSPSGWVQQGITTVHAAAPAAGSSSSSSGGALLAQSFNATAASVFAGVPAPGLNTSCSPSTSPPCDLPRLFGVLRLLDGSYLLAATAAFAGTPPHATPDGPRAPVSLLAFASQDTFTWAFQGVIANASLFPWTDFGPTESDLAYTAAAAAPGGGGTSAPPPTLAAVVRMSGDSDCQGGGYSSYYAAYSSDAGASWSLPAELPGLGCVRPRLLLAAAGGPLLLSGGRNCVAGTKDISLWASATGGPGASWAEASLTYQHNRLWQGNASFRFDAGVNDTGGWETLSYTALVPMAADTVAVFYNKFFSPHWPPWPSANFVMQVRIV